MTTLYAEAQYGKVVMKTKELSALRPGQLLLEAECSALSPGTEHSLLEGNVAPLPSGIGYSMIATVVDTGDGVRDYKPGDLVAVTGQHASHLIVDEKVCSPVPAGIDKEQAAYFVLAHTALYGIRRTKIQLGESVVVLGYGMVGAFAAQFAKLSGAVPVIVTGHGEKRMACAKEMGLHYAIDTNKEPDKLREVVDSLGTGGVSVVLEATGQHKPLLQAFDIVKEGGRIMMLSTVFGSQMPDISEKLFQKGVAFIGGYVNSKPYTLRRYDP